jgi:hypothetical protein
MSYFIELEENADGDLFFQIPEEVLETLDKVMELLFLL